jgi:thiamine pyrophosphate-dependent acetolactate synthase large subunit-like protein
VVLNLPIDIQAEPAPTPARTPTARPVPTATRPTDATIARIADLLQSARSPAIIAGRGAVLAGAGAALTRIAEATGALLATSAQANGLFTGHPQGLGISGGFTSPQGADLLRGADLIIAVGASLNAWTTRHGALINPAAQIVQIDDRADAIGRHRPVDIAVHADAGETATLLAAAIAARTITPAAHPPARPWHEEPYDDESSQAGIDPRTFSIALERRLGPDKTVAVDSGAFMGYPSMYLSVAHARAWVFVNGYQSIGLALGNAIGAAVARPDRPTLAAVGDGGLFMALAELETAVRLGVKLLVAVYDDRAYGAEVHHFAPMGHDVSRVQFPDADLAAIARACGAHAAIVRRPDDLDAVTTWLAEAQPRPLVLDAKVNPAICADWLAEAFRAG